MHVGLPLPFRGTSTSAVLHVHSQCCPLPTGGLLFYIFFFRFATRRCAEPQAKTNVIQRPSFYRNSKVCPQPTLRLPVLKLTSNLRNKNLVLASVLQHVISCLVCLGIGCGVSRFSMLELLQPWQSVVRGYRRCFPRVLCCVIFGACNTRHTTVLSSAPRLHRGGCVDIVGLCRYWASTIVGVLWACAVLPQKPLPTAFLASSPKLPSLGLEWKTTKPITLFAHLYVLQFTAVGTSS